MATKGSEQDSKQQLSQEQQTRQLLLVLVLGLASAAVTVAIGLTVYFVVTKARRRKVHDSDGYGSGNASDYGAVPGAAGGSKSQGGANWTPASSGGGLGVGQAGSAMMPAAGPLPGAMQPGHMQQQQLQLRVVELPAATNPAYMQQQQHQAQAQPQQLRVVELPQMTPKLPADPASRSTGSKASLSLVGSGAPLVLAGGAPRPGIQQLDPAHMPSMNGVGLPD